jgi:hypothetical protein
VLGRDGGAVQSCRGKGSRCLAIRACDGGGEGAGAADARSLEVCDDKARAGLRWRADYGSPSLQRDVDSSAGCRHEQIGGNDAAVMRLQGCTSYRRCSAADGAVSEQEAARDAKSRSLRDAYCVRLHARRGGTLCPAALPAQLSGRLGWGLPRRCHSLADPWC